MDRKHEKEKFHEVEKSMIEFAAIHLRNRTMHFAAAERVHLMLGISGSLFSANIGYHQCCYKSFRSGHFKTSTEDNNTSTAPEVQDHSDVINEFVCVIEHLVVVRKEIYTLRQLRELWADTKGVEFHTVRAIDIKNLLMDTLSPKIQFCKSSHSAASASEFIMSSDITILPDAIHSIVTGKGITNLLQLKAISRLISKDIQSQEKYSWPPTPQEIIERDDMLDKRMYNIIAWIVSPNSYMGKDGYVNLSSNKATKVSEICQNIQSLVPGGQPSLGQVLLSLTMFGKTGSKNVVNDLRQLGHGLSYTETMFVMDKWAEWCLKQKSLVPSNIIKGVIATHTFDNIDWKNKNIKRIESHFTNSIIVQKYNLVEEFSKVSLNPDYDFVRKKHRSFKATSYDLPVVNFKRGAPRILKYTPMKNQDECKKSSLRTLVWVLSRMRRGAKVPSWRGFEDQA